MIHDNIDYFALERKNHAEGSFNGDVKNLVVFLRHIRTDIPATEIDKHLPEAFRLEKKLHKVDDLLGQSRREYVKEIWELLENEPEPDDTKTFQIYELKIDDDNKASLVYTYESFPQHIIAEEWIKESGDAGIKYVILEVIEP